MRAPLRRLASPLQSSTGRVCLNCRRAFSSTSPVSTSQTQLPASPVLAGIAPISSRRLISVAGADAAKFLQGIITANIFSKENGNAPRQDPFYCGFLNATGRVLHDVFVYPDPTGILGGASQSGSDGGFLIEADAAQLDTLARYIKRYKLRAKVTVRKIDEGELSVWQAWGGATEGPSVASGLVFKDPRAPSLGFRVLQPGGSEPQVDLERTSEEAYTVRRYLNGVPEGQDEILKETGLPQESNMDFMGGIDYHKGCYVGQELTIRTKHRGVVRKRILPCVIYDKSSAPPTTLHYEPEGTTTSASSATTPSPLTADMVPQDTSIGRCEKRGRSAGKWLKGVGNIGLGLCRLEIMTGVQLPGETAAAAFSPEDEFMLEWGGDDESGTRTGVKVKAFVPEWVQAGLDAAGQK